MSETDIQAALVCAAPIEYELCRDVLRLVDENNLGGRRVSRRTRAGAQVVAVAAGQGKIQSAAGAQLIVDEYRPQVVIDVGAAGSLTADLGVPHIVCAERAYEYDVCSLDDFTDLAPDLTTDTLLSDLTEEGHGILRQFGDWVKDTQSVGFAIGDILCGERNVDNAALRERLCDAFGAVACTWETSAVLRTARLNGVRSLALRVITDDAGEDMSQQLRSNWREALLALYSVLDELIVGNWLMRMLRHVR